MKYVDSHQRRVRGKLVHTTQEERKAEQIELAKEMKNEVKRLEAIAKQRAANAEESIEAKFLTPKSKNFVVTEAVKEYADRAMLWLKANYPVHLIGPTGCGKTALAIHMAEKLGKPAVWINGDEELTTHELIGGYSRIEMSTLRDKYIHNVYKSKDIVEPMWVNNPLALACQHGYTLIYNEFSRSKPEANNVLLSILEEGILELPTKFGEERYVKVHPDFNLILTSNNIEYAGVHQPQDALLDRVVSVYMGYYDKETEIGIVRAHSGLPVETATKIVELVRFLRTKLEGAQVPGTRPAIMIANGVKQANGITPELFEQLCVDVIASKTKDPKDLKQKREFIRAGIEKARIC